MFLVTYPSRALGVLTPGMERLPRVALDYLQLVGPAVLTALAAVSVLVAVGPDGATRFHVGIEALAVAACLVVVVWRRNLFIGLVVAVLIVIVARTLGLPGPPG
jgi:branched-subunit amino acid transport protein